MIHRVCKNEWRGVVNFVESGGRGQPGKPEIDAFLGRYSTKNDWPVATCFQLYFGTYRNFWILGLLDC